MARHYPQVGTWSRTSRECYFLILKCDGCDKKFGPHEKYWRRETQVSWFRGDDEVESLCDHCKANKKEATHA